MRAMISCLVLAAISIAQGVERDEFRWRSKLSPGRVIEIKGVNGSIRAGAASGSEVEVHAIKRGRRNDPKDVEIRVVEREDGATICAVYPSKNSSRPNECTPGEGGRMDVRDNDVQVDFEVRVPSGVRFTGRTVNGNIEVESVSGEVGAYTVNGGVRISTARYAKARTVNGSITASLGDAAWQEPLSFETVNGSITLELPGSTSTEVSAKTVNGGISTDFPLTIKGGFLSKRISGTIGNGGRGLNLSTVNGSIRIRRTGSV